MKTVFPFLFALLLLLVVPSIGASRAVSEVGQEKKQEQTVYVTKTGEKYHRSGCRYLKYSKIKKDIAKAVKEGYSACSVCSGGKTLYPRGSSSSSSQCTGKTKAGNRCKRMTKNSDGKCYQH